MDRWDIALRGIAAITLSFALGGGAWATTVRTATTDASHRDRLASPRVPGRVVRGTAEPALTRVSTVAGTVGVHSFSALSRQAQWRAPQDGDVYIFGPAAAAWRPATVATGASRWFELPEPGMGLAVTSTLLLGLFYLFRRVS